MKKLSANKGSIFNIEHDTEDKVPAYILETWLVENPEQDKSFSTYGIKVPKGTMFVVAQLTDKEYFDKLVANEQTGFSIEGFLGLKLSEIINNNKQKEEKMNELTLPDGEHTIGEKIYVVKDGKVIEVKDVVKEELSTEEEVIKEEVKEEELSSEEEIKEEVKEEVKEEMQEYVVTEEVVTEETSTYSKADLDAKFDELYKMIADLKTETKVEEVEEVEETKVELSAHQRFSAVTGFLKSKK
jgi:hypothetical protein